MNDTVKGVRSSNTVRPSDRIRKGPFIMAQRKNAVAKKQPRTKAPAKAPTTAPAKEAVTASTPAPTDVMPSDEYIASIGALGVQVGQNTLFGGNTGAESKLRLTDTGIAKVWNKAWPNRKIVVERGGFTAHHVVGARRDYNKGTHGKDVDGNIVVPEIKCGKWVVNPDTHEKKYIEP